MNRRCARSIGTYEWLGIPLEIVSSASTKISARSASEIAALILLPLRVALASFLAKLVAHEAASRRAQATSRPGVHALILRAIIVRRISLVIGVHWLLVGHI